MKPHLEHLFAQTRRNGAVTAAEWWWCRPEALQEIGNILLQDNFVIVDHFLPPTEASSVRGEVTSAYEQGLLTHSGATGGGRFGRSESFTDRALRSDVLGYFDGVEPEWRRNGDGLKRALDKMNTIVCELRDCTTSDGSSSRIVPELGRISTRSRAMVTCYPGRDSLYTKHYDNAIGNGRKLTAILYLNEEWKLGDGGELKLYKPTSGVDNADYVIIEPKLGRVLMFWSDKRCPHEVLPSKKLRFAVTLWFIDAVERDARTERDAAESKLQTQETKFHDPAVLSTILVEPESCCRAEVSASRRNHAIQQGCSLNDTYGVYCISDFTAEDMKSAIIDSACDVIIVASKSGLFDSMKILLARKIISDRTEAKYKKKLQCLQIMVYYS